MSKIPEFQDFSKLHRSFVSTPFSVEMAADGSADLQLFDAATSIKIGSLVWKIGDAIYSMGDQAVTKLKCAEILARNMCKHDLKESLWEEEPLRKFV